MLMAIEGIDGSGKGTQAAAIQRRSVTQGLSISSFSFPRYGANPFADAVSAYLNGQFGVTNEVSPYLAALLYAGDRFCARDELIGSGRRDALVVCDRYVDSNIAHQAAKLPPKERLRFIRWIENVEYGAYGMPRADLTVFLVVPVKTAVQLIRRKPPRAYTARTADIHEADPDYLQACAEVYAFLVDRNPGTSIAIDCIDGGQLRSEESIADEIWQHVSQRLGRSVENVL